MKFFYVILRGGNALYFYLIIVVEWDVDFTKSQE